MVSGYNAGQKVYKSTDGGATWNNISGVLPTFRSTASSTRTRRRTRSTSGPMPGCITSRTNCPIFVPSKLGLPNVIIDELEIHVAAKKIVAATYGRGLWQSNLMP